MRAKPPAEKVEELLGELNMTCLDELDIVRIAEYLKIEVRYERLDALSLIHI